MADTQSTHEVPFFFEARAARSTWLIFGAMFGPLCTLGMFEFRETKSTVICSLVLLSLVAWLCAFRITFDGRTLTYRTLFGGKKSILLEQIATVRREIGAGGPFSPTYRLVVEPSDERTATTIVVNVKVFGKQDIGTLTQILDGRWSVHPSQNPSEG